MASIHVLGSVNIDLVVQVPHFPSAGETVAGGKLVAIPGGKGANQACAAARLGCRTRFCGCVGTDLFATDASRGLVDARVDLCSLKVVDDATGSALIQVQDDGQNTIVISAGANAALDTAAATGFAAGFNRADVLLLQLETPLDASITAARMAKAKGMHVILDPAPFQPLPAELLAHIDYLTPNQTEAAQLVDMPDFDPSNRQALLACVDRLARLNVPVVILKLGHHGCLLVAAETVVQVSSFSVAPIDSTAAGDIFNAAFAVAHTEGKSNLQAAIFASAAAALSVTRRGAQDSIPSREEADAFFSSHPAPEIHYWKE